MTTSSEREWSKRQLMYVKVRETVLSSLSTVCPVLGRFSMVLTRCFHGICLIW